MKLDLTSLASRLRTRGGVASRRVASGTALTLVASLLVVMAVNAEGSPITKVDLNDGSVWVTKDSQLLVGRLNSQIQALDLGVVSSSSGTDLFQQASDVQVIDLGGSANKRVMLLDVAGGAMSKPVEVPKSVVVSAARRTVAVVDTQSGKGWLMAADRLDGFSTKATPATIEGLGQHSNVVVSPDGIAYFLSRADEAVVPIELDVNGIAVVKDSKGLDGSVGDDTAMTVVGGHPIVLDRASGTIDRVGGGSLRLDGSVEGAQLQLPQGATAGSGDDVFVATRTGLFKAGIGGGKLTKVSKADVDGVPAAPAVVSGCVYAAWLDLDSAENFERVCGDNQPPRKIPSLGENAQLAFRVNREVVVLNDTLGGYSWMVQAGMKIVNNWDEVDPRIKEKPEQTKTKQKDDHKNKPPKAKDDKDFGARPGSTVVLPVTVNDTDPDGDILTVSPTLTSDGGSDVALNVVGNGTQVQVRIGANVSNDVTFRYTVTDGQPGHGESNSATVTLKIVTRDDDAKPKKFKERENELTVARGHEAEVNVMPAWYDPDGDTLALVGASSKGGEVRFRPDGTITFVDDGKSAATDSIDFTLRGGKARVKAKVAVSVVDPGKAVPATVADRVTGVAGSPIVVEPLENDTDPLGNGLRITRADEQPAFTGEIEVNNDADRGLVTVTAKEPKSYYVDYVAANDSGVAKPQRIRVDVVSAGKNNRPPVAEKDTANLVSGRPALVDVLANDSDPDGDVLIVRGFDDVPDGVKVSLIDRRFVRVEATAPLDDTVEVTYHLTDGKNPAEGTIAVSSSEGDRNRPPVAIDDVFTVRAGTIVNVPIVANDSDPDGDRLTVYGQDLVDVPKDLPVAASGSTLRILVPSVDEPTDLDFGYTVRDPALAAASARVVLNIKPDSKQDNERPKPAPIEARAIAGKKVRIGLNAFDSDPDGDPVSLTSIVQQPNAGRIIRTGADWVEYEPYEDSAGTDTFRVKVADQYDSSASTDVRIGVTAREDVNQSPTALDDVLFIKPERTIQFPVRDNDSDPDGDGFSLLREVSTVDGITASVVGDTVEMTSPALDGGSSRDASAVYTITDRIGGTSSAKLTLTSSELAPDYAPTATDDIVPLSKIAGKKPGDTIDVDVLDNDGDLDGSRDRLRFESVSKVSVKEGKKLTVTLTKDNQVVAYRLIDQDDEQSFGFVYVAGTDSVPPVLDESKVPVPVVAGELTEIDLTKIVNVRTGHEPSIARRDKIVVDHGDGKTESSSGAQTLVFRARKGYYGPAAMTFDVTDGKDLNDDDGLVSQITVPIDVEPAANVAPVVRSVSVDVAQGGDAVEIATEPLASDANPKDELSFEVGDGRNGVSGKEDGDVIKVKADKDADIGDVVELQLRVSDGKVKKPAIGTIRVRVRDTVLRPMTLDAPIRVDGKAGTATSVDLAEHVLYDPFPKKSKTVSGLMKISGEGSFTTDGTSLKVTPARDFDGVLVIGFEMSDGSGVSSRTVAGRLEVTVADKPDAPGKPTATAEGADAVRLSWSAPDDNGKPIDEYDVVWNGGSRKCTGTECLIDDLSAGTEYTFAIRAHNEVGWSEPGPKSAPVKPDVKPERMEAPTVDPATAYPARDKKLDVAWNKPPDNGGSEITGYEIEPSPGGSRKFSGAIVSSTFSSLANGTDYRFRARAINDKGEGPWSNWSESATPFTKPGQVSGVSAEAAAPDSSGSGYVDVSWDAADAGGDPDGVKEYSVELVGDGQRYAKTVTGTETSFSGVQNGVEYSARVKAVNRAGESEAWGESGKVLVYDYASAPRNVDRASDGDKSGVVKFDAPSDDGGLSLTKYGYSTSAGTSGSATPSSVGGRLQMTVNFGKNYDLTTKMSVSLWAIGTKGSTTAISPNEGSSGAVFMPYGAPTVVDNGSISGDYMAATVKWKAVPNGRAIDHVAYTGDASDSSASATGQKGFSGIEGGSSRCLDAVAHAGGKSSSPTHLCGTAKKRVVIVYFENAPEPTRDANGNVGCSAKCDWVKFRVEGFLQGSPTASAKQIGGSCGGDFGYERSVNVGPNGYGTMDEDWWFTGCNETVRITVDGIPGDGNPPNS